MGKQMLLSNGWKKIGWVLTFIGIIAGIWVLNNDPADFFTISLPGWTHRIFIVNDFLPTTGTESINILDEIAAITLLSGLLILTFSREKLEDEWVQLQRLKSLQWAVLTHSLVLILAVIFIHGMFFLDVLVYNLFTLLFFFVLRFNFVVHLKSPTYEK